MVRNWQARVEQADVRRKQAKQKKQLSEDKRLWKQWVVDFVNNQLDSNVENLLKIIQLESATNLKAKSCSDQNVFQLQLQIWTDTAPTSLADQVRAMLFTDESDSATVNGRKNRSKSFGEIAGDEEDQVAAKRSSAAKGRGRTNSVVAAVDGPPASSKKKAHPRSKGSLEQSTTCRSSCAPEFDDAFICRSHFFTGSCDHMNSRCGGKKNSTCRNVHLSNEANSQTLYHALMKWNTVHVDNTLQLQKAAKAEILFAQISASSGATVPAGASSSPSISSDPVIVEGAMDMIHYAEIPLILKSDDKEMLLPPSGQITSSLSKLGLHLGSVVFVALNGVLIFDRHQDGRLYKSNQELLVAVFGTQIVSNVVGCKRDYFCTKSEEIALLVNMPASVLLQVVSFLPDESVGSMMQVCQSWRSEIGCSDSPLWKFLLDRHNWPYPESSRMKCTFLDQFREHYAVMRDMKALEKGYLALHTGNFTLGRNVVRDFALHAFSANMNPPPSETQCVAVEEWSTNRLLVAYNLDCTVRLFETVPKVSGGGAVSSDKFCRELICYRLDPYWNTKRKQCSLKHLVLDDDYITALCTVEEHGIFGRKDILVVLKSGSVVKALDGHTDDSLQPLRVLSIEDTVQNYLVSHASSPPLFLRLLRGEEDGDINTSVSKSLSSCGNGVVLMEVVIYFESENSSESSSWLFLVSTKLNQILWSDGGVPEALPQGGLIEKTIVARRRKFKGRLSSRDAYDFVVGSAPSTMGNVIFGTVDSGGIVEDYEVLESSCGELERPDAAEGWYKPRNERLVTISPNDIIALDFWIRADMNTAKRRTIVTFYPRSKVTAADGVCTTNIATSSLSFPGKIHQVRCVRDIYLILICQQHEVNRTPELFDTAAGQWFGSDYSAIDNSHVREDVWDYSIPVIVVHIPTRREIGRIMLRDGRLHEELDRLVFPVLVSNGQATIGLGVSSKGVVMTGDDMRSCIGNKEADDGKLPAHSFTKKKKNSVRSKKDSFRTHNGDRCY